MAKLTKEQKEKLAFIEQTVKEFVEEQNKLRPEIETKLLDDVTKLLSMYIDAGYNVITVSGIMGQISQKIHQESLVEWRKTWSAGETLDEVK